MKALLVVMMLGGYNSNTPAVSTQAMPSKAACDEVAVQIGRDFERRLGEGWSNEGYQSGPWTIRVKCYEVAQ